MRRYVFSQGKVTVEDGVYSPVVHPPVDKPDTACGVLILVEPEPALSEPEATAQAQEQPHVQAQ